MRDRYYLVFTGRIRDGFAEEDVKRQLAITFEMPLEQVERIFTGHPVVVRSGLSRETAETFLDIFTRAGADCLIETEKLPFWKPAARRVPVETIRLSDDPEAAAPDKPEQTGPNDRKDSGPKGFWRRFFIVAVALYPEISALLNV